MNAGSHVRPLITHWHSAGKDSRTKGLQRTPVTQRGSRPQQIPTQAIEHPVSDLSFVCWTSMYFCTPYLELLRTERVPPSNFMHFGTQYQTLRQILTAHHTTLTALSKFTSTEAVQILCVPKVSDPWQHQITGNLLPKSLKYTQKLCQYST